MNLSPLDIRKHEFRKTFRGYDTEEVTGFLEMVASEFETIIREASQLKERTSWLKEQLDSYHDLENTLRETLISAQRAREETLTMAKNQAEVIVREAEVRAASVIEEGRREIARLRGIFGEMEIQKESYLARLRALSEGQIRLLETLEFPEEKSVGRFDAAEAERLAPEGKGRRRKNAYGEEHAGDKVAGGKLSTAEPGDITARERRIVMDESADQPGDLDLDNLSNEDGKAG